LRAAAGTDAQALLITPVDTPDASPAAARRVLETALAEASVGDALAQATYAGAPGHPVLVGRSHWAALSAAVSGDRGARPFLAEHGVVEVECIDLWSGEDVDRR
jgi:CTP:molybdopterin cytidylyltransferase MocA